MTESPKGPVLIDLGDAPVSRETPATAPPPPEPGEMPSGQAMQTMAALAARRGSGLGRWALGLFATLLGIAVSVALWDFVTNLLSRAPILGYTALALTAAFVLVLILIALREARALMRLSRVESLHRQAEAALASGQRDDAVAVTTRLVTLYSGREETRWGRDRFTAASAELVDADAILGLAEREILAPLDTLALREVEAAARQVAAVTAVVPLALADVFAAFTANLRMIRRIAEVYGGRAGTLGAWRLTRSVLTHLVATGAVAVGDDLLQSVAGGGILSRVSRRFGEGVVNGALTARVGVAALEVCRPLPFRAVKRPSVSGIVKRALTGLFSRA